MAAWQYDLQLVPRAAPDCDDSEWIGHATDRWRDILDEVLPRGPTWSEHLLGWGEYDQHRIEAHIEAGQLSSLRVRLDLRQDNLDLLVVRLAAAARALDACFQGSHGARIDADARALAEVIRASPAARFVKAPRAFLRRVELGGYEDA